MEQLLKSWSNLGHDCVMPNLSTQLEEAEFLIDDSDQNTEEELVLSCVSCGNALAPRAYSLAENCKSCMALCHNHCLTNSMGMLCNKGP